MNSRPIAAPICATSLAGPSRSSRAIREACRLAGTGQRWGRSRSGGVPCFALALRLQHRLRHFLHEQRNTVGAPDDVLPDVRRQRADWSSASGLRTTATSRAWGKLPPDGRADLRYLLGRAEPVELRHQ